MLLCLRSLIVVASPLQTPSGRILLLVMLVILFVVGVSWVATLIIRPLASATVIVLRLFTVLLLWVTVVLLIEVPGVLPVVGV